MLKSTYQISKMDCPSEEGMIRMKLEGLSEIKELEFDLEGRMLHVIHSDDNPEIESRLSDLDLGSKYQSTQEVAWEGSEEDNQQQSRLLWWVLGINFGFFILEMTTGIISHSMGLVADSLDMLADSMVYGLSLWAVGSALSRKKRVAKISGYLQLSLALFGIIEVVRRFFFPEGMPDYQFMIYVSAFALLGNALSLYILQKSKSKQVHMKASIIFTSNDIAINIGVMAAGILVLFTQSKYPDLIIGATVFVIVARGAFRILKLAK